MMIVLICAALLAGSACGVTIAEIGGRRPIWHILALAGIVGIAGLVHQPLVNTPLTLALVFVDGVVGGYLAGYVFSAGGGWWWRRGPGDGPDEPAPAGPDPEDHRPEAEPITWVSVGVTSDDRPSDDELLAALDFETPAIGPAEIYRTRHGLTRQPCPLCGIVVDHRDGQVLDHLREGIPSTLPESACPAGPDPLGFWRECQALAWQEFPGRYEP